MRFFSSTLAKQNNRPKSVRRREHKQQNENSNWNDWRETITAQRTTCRTLVVCTTIFVFNLLLHQKKTFSRLAFTLVRAKLLLIFSHGWKPLRFIRRLEKFSFFLLFWDRDGKRFLHLMLHHNYLIRNDFERKFMGTHFWRVNEIESGCVSPWVLIKSQKTFSFFLSHRSLRRK